MTPINVRNLVKAYIKKYYNNSNKINYEDILKRVCKKFSLPEKHSTFLGDVLGNGIIELTTNDNLTYVIKQHNEQFRPKNIMQVLSFLKGIDAPSN